MRSSVISLGFGLLIGVIGALSSILPNGAAWEEDTGLGLLFRLRGPLPTPQQVVVVAINGNTARQLGLSDEITQWPRSLYAGLIERLSAAGAAVIVFDIFFKKAQIAAQDGALAAAMRRSGNVVLVGYLEQEALDFVSATTGKVEIERLKPPLATLADSALTVAPFALPKIPIKVSRFWTFHGANELASLPSAALELYADPDGRHLQRLATAMEPDLQPIVADSARKKAGTSGIRSLLRRDPRLRSALLNALTANRVPEIPLDKHTALQALLNLYGESDYPYLNFYGPPGSVFSIPLHELLAKGAGLDLDLRGKVVFVGYSDRYQPKQKDGFYTVFSQADGLDLSGVEIAATAFANLLQRETIKPLALGQNMLLLVAYGIAITLLLSRLQGLRGSIFGVIVASGYFLMVYILFSGAQVWLPWIIPLFVQTPLAIIGVSIWHYREAHRGRQRLRQAFGYYLPGEVVDQLAEDTGQTLALGESRFGVCLASDAEQYTRLAESLSPEALQPILNEYYELLFRPVRARGGTVSDVVGDAMMAIWSAPQGDVSIRRNACAAALEITRAIGRSNSAAKLPTRIGLHAGQLVMSHVGAIDHYEYRAVGDIVNTAARIENLNKSLGTSILASQEVLDGLDDFICRDLGVFQLQGKQQSLRIFEIISSADAACCETLQQLDSFSHALAAWQQGDRQSAKRQFEAIQQTYPQDGPARYYLSLCHACDTAEHRDSSNGKLSS